jgi:hypothetical protein
MPTGAIVTPMSRNALSTLRGQALSPDSPRPNDPIITPMSFFSDITTSSNFSSGTYPAANRATAAPFQIAAPFLVRKVFWFNGTTATTDSADVGVYAQTGELIVSGGGTAISGASQLQEVDVADTLLRPCRYWLAYVQNGVTATPVMSATAAAILRAMGVAQMASAYPLPSTLVPAALASAALPMMGVASRTLV